MKIGRFMVAAVDTWGPGAHKILKYRQPNLRFFIASLYLLIHCPFLLDAVSSIFSLNGFAIPQKNPSFII